MIPTSSMTALMGLDAFTISGPLHDQDIAMAARFVADCPTFDFWPPRRGGDNVNRRRQRTIPCALPVVGRHGRAAGNDQGE